MRFRKGTSQSKILQLPGLVLLAGLTSCGVESGADQPSDLSGYGATARASDRIVLQETPPPVSDIAQVISTVSPSRDQILLTNGDLAHMIAVASECLDLDARVLTSLIRRESAFRESAVSPTGAMGLTQFTEIAVKEVRDQLGFGPVGSARGATVTYFRDKTRGCVAQQLGLQEWRDPWDETPEISPGAVKVALMDNPVISVVYGAILLKTDLAVEWQVNGGTTRDIYRHALMRYNGDPAVREAYANKILEWADAW